MKKNILAIITAGVMCVSLAGCNGNSSGGSSAVQSAENTKSVSEKANDVKSAVAFATFDGKEVSMKDLANSQLKDVLGIDPADVAEFSAYICPVGAVPDEFGIFTAKDTDAAGRIKESLDKRVEHQKTTFKDYTPNEMYKFDDSFVEQSGNTVIYSICGDNAKVKELLK